MGNPKHTYKRMKKRKWLALGSISEGSRQYEDVIPKLLAAAMTVRLRGKHWPEVKGIADEYDSNFDDIRRSGSEDGADLDADGTIGELKQEAIESLIDILNNYTPPFTELGYHGDDGANLGVWVSDADIPFHGPATEFDDIAKGTILPQARITPQDYFLQINDHGNGTLWMKRRYGKSVGWTKCWSVV